MQEKLVIGLMTEQESRQIAATAWCGEGTQNEVMNVDLAMEFAKILRREVNKRRSSNPVGQKCV